MPVPTLRILLEHFSSIRRLVLVAARGLLSLDNLEELLGVELSPSIRTCQAVGKPSH